MKRIALLILLCAGMVSACQQTPQVSAPPPPPPVDIEGAKREIGSLLDNYHNSMKKKDATMMGSLLAEDGLFCGTDSKEMWDKEAFSDYIRQAFADTSVVINYVVDRRKIRVAPDGNSAVAVEQFTDPATPKIPTRVISHMVRTGPAWKLDFTSWSLVPSNEDLPKINEAVSQ